jgi:hypothetical protein
VRLWATAVMAVARAIGFVLLIASPVVLIGLEVRCVVGSSTPASFSKLNHLAFALVSPLATRSHRGGSRGVSSE